MSDTTRDPSRFGSYGGRYAPVALARPLAELAAAWDTLAGKRAFRRRLSTLLHEHAGRPTPLYAAGRLSAEIGGARILLKREDLLHTGSLALSQTLGQALLAAETGRQRLVAESASGRHGVAVAAAAALLGLRATVYLAESESTLRHHSAVESIRLYGGEVAPVSGGLPAAMHTALLDWGSDPTAASYVPSSALGPDPFPRIVAELLRVVGEETRGQLKTQAGRALPDLVVASASGGAALGMLVPFVDSASVRLVAVEAGGSGLGEGEHAARHAGGIPGVFHGARTLVLQGDDGRLLPTRSLAAGLACPALEPQLAHLAANGRIDLVAIEDAEAVEAVHRLARGEGILPSVESAHALAEAMRRAAGLSARAVVVVCLAARGDDGVELVQEYDAGRRGPRLKRSLRAPDGLPPAIGPAPRGGHGGGE